MNASNNAAKALELPRDEPAQAPDVLEEIARHVQKDAQQSPEAYLKETIVPGGGE